MAITKANASQAKKAFKKAWKKEKKKQSPKHPKPKKKTHGSVASGTAFLDEMRNAGGTQLDLDHEQWRQADQSLTNWHEVDGIEWGTPAYMTVRSVNERRRMYQMGYPEGY